MGIRQQDICNRVMAQAQGIAESDFPIDAFPAKVQCVILGMVRHENFKVEYLAAAMLSAAASALGNTYNIRVKGHWTTNAALYIIMVGRPGLRLKPYSVRSAKGTAGHWRNSRLKWPPIRIQ